MLSAAFLTISLLALPPGVDPELFPDVAKHSPEEIELAGLAMLYPGRILHEAPRAADDKNKSHDPLVVELPRKLTYVRVYDLDISLIQLSEALKQPAVIIDLRYLWADATSAEKLAQELSKAGLDCDPVDGIGKVSPPAKLPHRDPKDTSPPPVVLVLINGQTAGPIEAWLQAFQAKDGILAVGTPTAGQPGHYTEEGHPGIFIMDGELEPVSGSGRVSVAGTGVKPRFPVEVTPDQNYRAYFDVERGASITTLLRQEHLIAPAAQNAAPAPAATTGNNNTAKPPAPTPPTPAPVAPSPGEELTDPVLQRAVDVVAALQVLGRMPASTAPAAGTPAATGSR